MPVSYDFRNRVAIVTGGSKGIGRRIAERLRDSGARVIVWDLHAPQYSGVSFAEADVSDAVAIDHALELALAENPKLDILVNNAGFTGSSTPVLELTPTAWRRIIEVNLFSLFEVSRKAVPIMIRSGYGRVVNVASLAGKDGTPLMSAYSAAKAGVIAFTKSFAKELALTNVRVNCIVPAAIDTEILHQLSPAAVATSSCALHRMHLCYPTRR